MSVENKPEEIIEEVNDELRNVIKKWRNEEGNLIMVFHEVQNVYGYVPRNIAMFVGEELGIPLARIYEIITFYHFFQLEPPAEYTTAVCTGTACYLKGAQDLVDEFKKKLNITKGAVYSEDRKYKIEEVRCIGCCGLAPVLTVNGEIHGHVNPEDIDNIIEMAMK